jgi:glycosyltransferase involved in cell wall biosynthesis
MPYAVYEALLMGVPVVAFPIGGQAELIGQTPSAQFLAENMSAKAFIQATKRTISLTRHEAVHIRKKILERLNKEIIDKISSSLKEVFITLT